MTEQYDYPVDRVAKRDENFAHLQHVFGQDSALSAADRVRERASNALLATCKHCGDQYEDNQELCTTCGEMLDDVCPECHLELTHGVIRNQNIDITGSGTGPRSPDQDPDAYAPSWKAGN